MRTSFKAWGKDERGLAALEFALAAPILLTLLLSGFEYARYLLIHQKAEKLAYTVADVVAQSTSVTTAQLSQTLSVTSQIMQPYSVTANERVIISSVYQSGTTNPPTVRWQYSGGGTLTATSRVGAVNGNATLPTGFTLNDKDNIIVAEVFYSFTPIFAGELLGTVTIYKQAIFKPRLGKLTTAPS